MSSLTITNPIATDARSLQAGDLVRANGQRTPYTVEAVLPHSVVMAGPRGGVAFLIPSIDGDALQLSKGLGASNKRDWIRSLEIERASVPQPCPLCIERPSESQPCPLCQQIPCRGHEVGE